MIDYSTNPQSQRSARPLRVVQVTPRFFPQVGGVETHVYEVGRRLVERGVEVSVLTTDAGLGLPAEEVIAGMRVLRVPAWPAGRDELFAPQIWHALAPRQWDVVHCQNAHTLVAPLGMCAAWRAGLPYVVSFHTGGATTSLRGALRGAQWRTLRPLFARATRLIGPSAWEVDYFQRVLRLPGKRFTVVPNGAHRLPDIAMRPVAPRPDPLIVSAGRLVRYKGHQRVIAALPHLLRDVPDARLRIAGVGPYEAALRQQAQRLGLADRVAIAGFPPDDQRGMAELMAQADLVTLLSEHEAQGITAMEALALGRPTLVADTTALHELAQQGLARSVAIDAAPERVAAAMLAQLREPLIPPPICFPTWEQCAADLLAIYQQAAHPAALPSVLAPYERLQ